MPALSPNMTIMLRAAEKAAKSLNRDFGEVENLQVSRKGPADFVTAADLRAEEIIFEELRKTRPSFGFMMEERGEVKADKPNVNEGEEFRFIVDPLDGTVNFLHGIPHFAISIALERQTAMGREIIAALVMDPFKNENFMAEKGTGAFLHNRRLRVSARKDLGVSIVAAAISTKTTEHKAFSTKVNGVVSDRCGFRRMGSAALDLCYVAAARFEGFCGVGLKPWDIAAGALIVKEAGGNVTSLTNEQNVTYSDEIIASNGLIHNDLKQMIEGIK